MLVNKLFASPLTYLYQRISKWNQEELYAWALGFSVGDVSLDRAYLSLKRVDLETSHIGSIVCFIAVFRKLAIAPIEIKFYERSNSYARYKMRAFVKVTKETLSKLASKYPHELKEIFDNEEYFLPFLGGFVDSDGSIQPYVKTRGKKTIRLYFEPEITLSEENKEVLEYLSKVLLKRYLIRSSVKYGFKGNFYRLRINSIKDVCIFVQLVSRYLLNIERIPKALIIKSYCNGTIKSVQRIKEIYNRLRSAQKILKSNLTNLIQLMVKNRLKLIIQENRIIIEQRKPLQIRNKSCIIYYQLEILFGRVVL